MAVDPVVLAEMQALLDGALAPPMSVTTISAPPLLVAPSSLNWLGVVKEWAHNAAAPLGLLMLVAYAVVAILNRYNIGLGAPAEIGYVGGALIALSKAIDSYSFTTLNSGGP